MRQRALGALAGLAIGDALGMPTQLLPRQKILQLFPTLDNFADGPPENEISAGQLAGSVTDDTQQALIIARLLIAGNGHIDTSQFIAQLLAWSREAEANGSEQLGPSSRRALEAIQQGLPIEQAGRRGDTNGAAMRIAPVGIAVPPAPLEALIDLVEDVCRPTHFTGLGIAGAAAVAAAISAGVSGATFSEALPIARQAARLGQQRGNYSPGASIGERLVWAVDLVSQLDESSALDAIYDLIGTGVAMQEAVPAAFALASLWPDDPWQACLAAAHLGGDSDTIGAITGAILGACCGIEAFPPQAISTIERVNKLDLHALSTPLLAVRATISTAPSTS
ncbi:ADP-ribosylglycohydrolase family protein [Ktedonosporobacter rubrisoli]|nr:ADP-ribosylglycohydrolase family protein [Ktedonosporobacter rubrisoli]